MFISLNALYVSSQAVFANLLQIFTKRNIDFLISLTDNGFRK